MPGDAWRGFINYLSETFRHQEVLMNLWNLAEIEQKMMSLESSRRKAHDLDSQVMKVSVEISDHRMSLLQTQKHEAELQKRIQRNANPRFLHYLVWNRKQKIIHLKRELQRLSLKTAGQDLSSRISADCAHLASLQEQKTQLYVDSMVCTRLKNQVFLLFSQVFDISGMKNADDKTQWILASKQALIDAICEIVTRLQECVVLFGKVENFLREAVRMTESMEDSAFDGMQAGKDCEKVRKDTIKQEINTAMLNQHLDLVLACYPEVRASIHIVMCALAQGSGLDDLRQPMGVLDRSDALHYGEKSVCVYEAFKVAIIKNQEGLEEAVQIIKMAFL